MCSSSVLVQTSKWRFKVLPGQNSKTMAEPGDFGNKNKNQGASFVSPNSGTPKSSILIRFSIINHPFWGTSQIDESIHQKLRYRTESQTEPLIICKLLLRARACFRYSRVFFRGSVFWNGRRSLEISEGIQWPLGGWPCVKHYWFRDSAIFGVKLCHHYMHPHFNQNAMATTTKTDPKIVVFRRTLTGNSGFSKPSCL